MEKAQGETAEKGNEDTPKEPFKYAGFLGAIGAATVNATGFLCIKLLPVEKSTQETAKACIFRGIFVALTCGALIMRQGHSFMIPKGEYVINFLRAFLGGIFVLLSFLSVNYITIGECSALIYTSSIWTSILGYVLLKERLKPTLFLAIPLGFLGLILLADPGLLLDTTSEETHIKMEAPLAYNHTNSSGAIQNAIFGLSRNTNVTLKRNDTLIGDSFSEHLFQRRLIGCLLALVSSLVYSTIIIVLKCRRKTPIVVCTFYWGIASLIVATAIQLVVGFASLPGSALEWFLLVCIGSCAYFSQMLVQWSLQFVPASLFAIMRCLYVMLCFVYGVAFLNEAVLWTSLLGSALIIIVVTMLILNDHFERGFMMIWRFILKLKDAFIRLF